MIVVFLTCSFAGFGIGGFSGCRIAGSLLFDRAGPSRIAIRSRICSPCELDAAGATMTVCLGSFGFGSWLLLLEGALGSARKPAGALDGMIPETGALDGRILVGALDGVAGLIDGFAGALVGFAGVLDG